MLFLAQTINDQAMRFTHIFCLLFAFCVFHLGQAQNSLLTNYLEAVREGSHDPVPGELLDQGNADDVLNSLVVYEQDSVEKIRSRAYNIAMRVGLKVENEEQRQRAVQQLVDGIGDTDGGVSGSCSSALTYFYLSDFSSAAQLKLLGYLKVKQYHLDEVIRLVGFVNPDGAKSKLQSLQSQVSSKQDRWAIRLALARLGDPGAVSYITSRLTLPQVNDDFVYDIVPDLVYTRSPEVFDFLEQILNSDVANCQTADPDRSDKILCGYRVLEYIAYTINDFPIATDTDHEIDVSDYEQALQEVRAWFIDNPDYTFNTTFY